MVALVVVLLLDQRVAEHVEQAILWAMKMVAKVFKYFLLVIYIYYLDVNECLAEGEQRKCIKDYEQCLNRVGSFSCECVEGYIRDLNGENCELDIEGCYFLYLFKFF